MGEILPIKGQKRIVLDGASYSLYSEGCPMWPLLNYFGLFVLTSITHRQIQKSSNGGAIGCLFSCTVEQKMKRIQR